MTPASPGTARRLFEVSRPLSPELHLVESGAGWHLLLPNGNRLFDVDHGTYSRLDAARRSGDPTTIEALLSEAGLDLPFPGGAPRVAQAIDADLLARAIGWAGEAATARNEIFNITNGDVFVWENVWPAIAASLGMQPGGHVPLSLDRDIRPREAEWEKIRVRHGLRSGNLSEFVGLSFEYADYTMGYGRNEPGAPAIVSTIKLMQAGFTEVMDTEAMFAKYFAEFQANRLLPSA